MPVIYHTSTRPGDKYSVALPDAGIGLEDFVYLDLIFCEDRGFVIGQERLLAFNIASNREDGFFEERDGRRFGGQGKDCKGIFDQKRHVPIQSSGLRGHFALLAV